MSEPVGVMPTPEGDHASWDVDPYDEALLSDPWDYYRDLRERGALVWLSRYGIWAVGRWAEVREVFGDWRRFCSSRGVGLQDFQRETPWRQPSIVLEADPPEHEKARKVMSRALSGDVVARLREGFQAEAAALVGALIERRRIDAVPDLAQAFPLAVFPDAVGLGPSERENLLHYGNMVFNALGPDNRLRQEALAMGSTVVPWITERCARHSLTGDGIGATIYQAADAGELTSEEASLLVRSLLSAGVDTTVAALGAAMLSFATHQEQWQLLRDDPSLPRAAFEEVLRFHSPVHSFCRTVNVDTSIGDTALREGDKILCVLASANRDPRRWERADELDIRRSTAGHVAFGVGIHKCVGQAIARLEGEVLLRALAARVRAIRLDGEPVWRPGNSLRTLESLPIELVAA